MSLQALVGLVNAALHGLLAIHRGIGDHRGMMGHAKRIGCAVLLAAGAAAVPARACEVALALTIDVSGSIDPGEYRLQMDGLAAALADPSVAEALVTSRAMVTVVQWSGASRQEVSIPWRHLTSFEDIAALEADVRNTARPWRHFSTAIGDMLHLTGALFRDVSCTRQVIDVSSDGRSNEGAAPDAVRDALLARGIHINALAILGAQEPDLAAYFREHVIAGPNAFVYSATGYEDYPRAIRRKLLDEITEPVS